MVRLLLLYFAEFVKECPPVKKERTYSLMTSEKKGNISVKALQGIKIQDPLLLRKDRHCNPVVRIEIRGTDEFLFSIQFEGTLEDTAK
jgi:hypothetical protein